MDAVRTEYYYLFFTTSISGGRRRAKINVHRGYLYFLMMESNYTGFPFEVRTFRKAYTEWQ